MFSKMHVQDGQQRKKQRKVSKQQLLQEAEGKQAAGLDETVRAFASAQLKWATNSNPFAWHDAQLADLACILHMSCMSACFMYLCFKRLCKLQPPQRGALSAGRAGVGQVHEAGERRPGA